jgi:hypothetical protein
MKHTIAVAALLTLLAARPAALAPGAAHECPFEITSNKPFVQVSVNGSGPQWFILDSGCSGGSVIARECAERLKLGRGDEAKQHLGAGAGVAVGVATTPDVTLRIGGDTLRAPLLRVFTLAHVAPFEGRSVDGLLGEDFLRRHVVEIDYAQRKIRFFEPSHVVPAGAASVVPITLENGLAVARGTLTSPGHGPIACRLVIDTGVRATVIFYHPFVTDHRLLAQQSHLLMGTVGGGAGGESIGDIGRVESLRIGPVSFKQPVAIFSRDTVGVFASRDADGIVGGELLRRCKVTFDYPHKRLLLEPYATPPDFEYDMSGLFLTAHGETFREIVIQSVAAGTPAAEAGLRRGDRIAAIDGQRDADLTLERVRAMFREPTTRRLDVERGGERFQVKLTTRRLV